MYRACVSFARGFTLRVDSTAFQDHNKKFVQQCSDTYEPRQNVLGVPPVSYVVLVHILGGVCEALAVVLPSSVGDAYVVLLLLWIVCDKRGRFVASAALMTVIITLGVPPAHGFVRMISCVAAVLCQHVQSHWRLVHPLVACFIVAAVSGRACTSAWRAMSPSLLMTFAIEARLNPKLVLTVFLCAWLV